MPTPKPPKTPPPPLPKKGKGLTFPPLVKQWTVKSDASWPGAEYTRRTRLKTHLSEDVSNEFMEEMRETLGEAHFKHYEEAMQPAINRKLTRGKPPAEKGKKAIQPAYILRRTDEPLDSTEENPLAGSTMSLSGHFSKSKIPDNMHSPWGFVPEYMFDDREKMTSLTEWFEAYGRPTPNAINLGPRQLYTTFEKSSKRCCGEPSNMTVTKKGFCTS